MRQPYCYRLKEHEKYTVLFLEISHFAISIAWQGTIPYTLGLAQSSGHMMTEYQYLVWYRRHVKYILLQERKTIQNIPP